MRNMKAAAIEMEEIGGAVVVEAIEMEEMDGAMCCVLAAVDLAQLLQQSTCRTLTCTKSHRITHVRFFRARIAHHV